MTLPFARGVRDVYIGPVVALSQPSSAEAGAPLTPVATETVRRPAPGLARGLWEASPAFFYTAGGFIVVVAVIYALWRKGIVRFRRPRSTTP